MALDEDDTLANTYNMKETIMRKLISARKRAQSETETSKRARKWEAKKGIEVSNFEIGDEPQISLKSSPSVYG